MNSIQERKTKMKRISNPRELEVGDKIVWHLTGDECRVAQKLGHSIVIEYPGGSVCTHNYDDHVWHLYRREKPKKVYRMRARTPKRAKQEDGYYVKARAFVARFPMCPVMASIYSKAVKPNQVHHMAGREGALLLDERHWLAVSQWGHDYIRDHANEAREHGWLYEADGEEVRR